MNQEKQIPEQLIHKIKVELGRHKASKVFWPRWVRLEVLRLHKDGVSTATLAAATGVPSLVIDKWARRKPVKRSAKLPAAEKRSSRFTELCVLAAPPAPDLRVRIGSAEISGFTVTTLGEFLRDAGWALR